MAEILLFHHALGLTSGVLALADDLRAAGHSVHTPDLYGGRTFSTVDEGVAYARSTGFKNIVDAGVSAAEGLPEALVFAGISLGVMPAQKLAQTRPGARGALLLEACLPASEFGASWPASVPVQVHGMEEDPSFAGEGDLDAARELVAGAAQGELFLYPGNGHLFSDRSLPSYEPKAAALLQERLLAFLAKC